MFIDFRLAHRDCAEHTRLLSICFLGAKTDMLQCSHLPPIYQSGAFPSFPFWRVYLPITRAQLGDPMQNHEGCLRGLKPSPLSYPLLGPLCFFILSLKREGTDMKRGERDQRFETGEESLGLPLFSFNINFTGSLRGCNWGRGREGEWSGYAAPVESFSNKGV